MRVANIPAGCSRIGRCRVLDNPALARGRSRSRPRTQERSKPPADSLGANAIKTLEFIASGRAGQNFTPNDPWPRVKVSNYTAPRWTNTKF